eukprot:Opistho-2@14694
MSLATVPRQFHFRELEVAFGSIFLRTFANTTAVIMLAITIALVTPSVGLPMDASFAPTASASSTSVPLSTDTPAYTVDIAEPKLSLTIGVSLGICIFVIALALFVYSPRVCRRTPSYAYVPLVNAADGSHDNH